jgi:uncharacterized protein
MAKLTDEMRELIETQQCFVATVNADGTPNISPKRSTRVLDDEHLMFIEVTGRQTWANLQAGSKVAIGVVDRDHMVGYRFMGTPEIVRSGELFERAAEAMRARGIMAPVKAVIKIKVDAIQNVGFAGAGAGGA